MHNYLDFEKPVADLESQILVPEGSRRRRERRRRPRGDPAPGEALARRAGRPLQEADALAEDAGRPPCRPAALPRLRRAAHHRFHAARRRPPLRRGPRDHLRLRPLRRRSPSPSSARRRAPTPRRASSAISAWRGPRATARPCASWNSPSGSDCPVLTLVDTAGAYPGIGAEERGQAEAIARSTEMCLNLKVPIVSRRHRRGRFGRRDRDRGRQPRPHAGARDLFGDLAGSRRLHPLARRDARPRRRAGDEDHRAGPEGLRRHRRDRARAARRRPSQHRRGDRHRRRAHPRRLRRSRPARTARRSAASGARSSSRSAASSDDPAGSHSPSFRRVTPCRFDRDRCAIDTPGAFRPAPDPAIASARGRGRGTETTAADGLTVSLSVECRTSREGFLNGFERVAPVVEGLRAERATRSGPRDRMPGAAKAPANERAGMLVRRWMTAALLAASLMAVSACQKGADLGDLLGAEAPVPAALVKEMKTKDMGVKSPDPGPSLQGRVRARGLEAEDRRRLRAAEDLFDLRLVRKARAEEDGRRPAGARGLLHRDAGPDEPELRAPSRLQHRLSQRLRPGERRAPAST